MDNLKVVPLRPLQDIPNGLRNIADKIEAAIQDGSKVQCLTLICGEEIFHLGTIDDAQAAANAIFDMTLGIHKMMSGALKLQRADDDG